MEIVTPHDFEVTAGKVSFPHDVSGPSPRRSGYGRAGGNPVRFNTGWIPAFSQRLIRLRRKGTRG